MIGHIPPQILFPAEWAPWMLLHFSQLQGRWGKLHYIAFPTSKQTLIMTSPGFRTGQKHRKVGVVKGSECRPEGSSEAGPEYGTMEGTPGCSWGFHGFPVSFESNIFCSARSGLPAVVRWGNGTAREKKVGSTFCRSICQCDPRDEQVNLHQRVALRVM